MKLLLDTHIFLWFITEDERLHKAYRTAICDPANEVFLSVASLWECLIKHSLGKLPLPGKPADYLILQLDSSARTTSDPKPAYRREKCRETVRTA